MDIEEFTACANTIEHMRLTENDKEKMLIRLLDLDRFIKAYTPSITIVDKVSHPLVIALEGNQRIGIAFIDVHFNCNSPHLQVRPGYHDDLKQSITAQVLDELWVVMVSEKKLAAAQFPELINKIHPDMRLLQNLKQLFLLDFHNCLLHPL